MIAQQLAATDPLASGPIFIPPGGHWWDACINLGVLNSKDCGGKGLVGNMASNALSAIVQAILDGYKEAVKFLIAGWTGVPTLSGVGDGVFTNLGGMAMWVGAAVALISVIWQAGLIVTSHRGSPTQLARGLLTYLVWSTSSVLIFTTTAVVCDELTGWFIDRAAGDLVASKMTVVAGVAFFTQPWLVGVFAAVGSISTLINAILMALRNVALVLCCLIAPVVAARAVTDGGRPGLSWWQRQTLALFLFKPAAGFIYAFSLYSLADASNVFQCLMAFSSGLLATASLPVLSKLLAPLGAGSDRTGHGMAAAGVAASGVMAGAALIGARGAGGAGSGASSQGDVESPTHGDSMPTAASDSGSNDGNSGSGSGTSGAPTLTGAAAGVPGAAGGAAGTVAAGVVTGGTSAALYAGGQALQAGLQGAQAARDRVDDATDGSNTGPEAALWLRRRL